jgi:hypothetical protein
MVALCRLEAFVKIKHEEVDEFFRRLLAGAGGSGDKQHDAIDQSRQLMTAFNKITDPRLRQELVVLIEIVAQMPDLLHRRRVWGKGGFAGVH